MRRVLISALAALALTGPAFAQSPKPIQIMLAYAQPHLPETDPAAAAGQEFRAQVRSLSGGRMTVELFPQGILGGNRNMTALAEKGVIQSALVTIGGVTPFYPPLMATQLPFAFDNVAQARAVLAGPYGQRMAADLYGRTALSLLGFVDPGGFHVLTNFDRDVVTPDDMWGLRVRAIPGFKPLEAMIEAVSALPIQVSSRDEYPMLATGAVDAQMSPAPVILARGFDGVQRHATLLDHLYSPYAWVFNSAFLDGLPAEDAAILREAVQRASAKAQQIADGLNASDKGLSGLAKRMDVRTLSTAQRREFQSVMQPPVEAAIRASLGEADAIWLDRLKDAARH